MTATTTAKKATPQQNREKKARLIARAAWRRGLTFEHLAAMPYSGEERSRTRFARMAYRESPDPADHEVNPPSGPESRTWRLVEDKIGEMTGRARKGLPCPERDLLHERQAWLPDAEDPWDHRNEEAGWSTPGSQDTSSGSSSEPPASGPSGNPQPTADAPDAGTLTTARSGFPAQRSSPPPPNNSPSPTPSVTPPGPSSPSPVDALPRGWGELAALPPLGYGWCIHHPGRRPVVITPDGGRCSACPPRRDEIPVKWDPTPEQLAALFGKKDADGVVVPFESVRDGWGMRLDWAPKHCNGPVVRCYCGRCPKGAPPN